MLADSARNEDFSQGDTTQNIFLNHTKVSRWSIGYLEISIEQRWSHGRLPFIRNGDLSGGYPRCLDRRNVPNRRKAINLVGEPCLATPPKVQASFRFFPATPKLGRPGSHVESLESGTDDGKAN